MQGWRKRQEDSYLSAISKGEKNDIDIFGVFDGHGGKEISQFVSNHFLDELLKNKNLPIDIPLALKETFIIMDQIMQTKEGLEELKKYSLQSQEEDKLQLKKEPSNSQIQFLGALSPPKDQEPVDIYMRTGCTACVMGIDESNKKIYFANAGDSRVILCRKGKAEEGSHDHKPEIESEKKRIYNADGWVSKGRVKEILNLTRGFGDLEYKQNKKLKPEEQMITANPDIKIVDYDENIDFIIIACDGIWDCLSNQEACDFVSKRLKTNPEIKLSEIIEEMFDCIITKDTYNNETGIGCDNMTCIIVLFKK